MTKCSFLTINESIFQHLMQIWPYPNQTHVKVSDCFLNEVPCSCTSLIMHHIRNSTHPDKWFGFHGQMFYHTQQFGNSGDHFLTNMIWLVSHHIIRGCIRDIHSIRYRLRLLPFENPSPSEWGKIWTRKDFIKKKAMHKLNHKRTT